MPFKIHCKKKWPLIEFTFHGISWKKICFLGRCGKKKSIVKTYIFWFELKFQELCCKQDQQKEKENKGSVEKVTGK